MNNAFKTIAFMVLLTAVFTGVVTVVKEATKERIALNESLTERRKVMLAFGATQDEKISAQDVERFFRESVREVLWKSDDQPIYLWLDAQGGVKAYAFPIGGAGFWGPILGYVGISGDDSTLSGIVFIRHSETPGLGARIEDLSFRRQFEGKSIQADGNVPVLTFVSEGRELDDRSVHAITGATQTSRALERFLNEDLREIHRAIERGEIVFQEGAR